MNANTHPRDNKSKCEGTFRVCIHPWAFIPKSSLKISHVLKNNYEYKYLKRVHTFKQILMQNKKQQQNRSSIVALNYTIKISKRKCNQLEEIYNKTVFNFLIALMWG